MELSYNSQQIWAGVDKYFLKLAPCLQAPTEKQLRYKEKVAELRKKRNSGLTKEQKEKYMVRLLCQALFRHM